jgi:hypothetical protein
MRRLHFLAAASLLGLFIACASGEKQSLDQVDPIANAGAGGGAGAAGSTAAGAAGNAAGSTAAGAAGSAGTGVTPDGGLDVNVPDAPPLDVVMYAHTDDTLYKIDPTNLEQGLIQIGTFDCVSDKSMTDLAIDRAQNLWGVSQAVIHRLVVQGNVVHCENSIPIQSQDPNARFYGLTFAPIGVLDPEKEVLVAGNTAGELWAVDDSGGTKLLGNLGVVPDDDGHGNSYKNAGKPWELSGDIVFLENKGDPLGFATVRDCPKPPSTSGCNNVDTLIEIDLKKLGKAAPGPMIKSVRGQIVQRKGCDDGLDGLYGNMYGIAAYNDRVYGFSNQGNVIDVATKDGSGCLVKNFGDLHLAGAGVTTIAPVEPPIN